MNLTMLPDTDTMFKKCSKINSSNQLLLQTPKQILVKPSQFNVSMSKTSKHKDLCNIVSSSTSSAIHEILLDFNQKYTQVKYVIRNPAIKLETHPQNFGTFNIANIFSILPNLSYIQLS